MKTVHFFKSLCVLIALFLFGTAFGSSHFIEDTSKYVKIGKQRWMMKNLDLVKFKNGDVIMEAKSAEEWKKAAEQQKPAWCYYDNDSIKGKKYGKLYNWYAVHDPRGLAPEGWHIPSKKEWDKLVYFLGGDDVAGEKMKSANEWHGQESASNESGFSGLPGGKRTEDGEFKELGYEGFWWSTTDTKQPFAPSLHLIESFEVFLSPNDPKASGFSVRCLRKDH